MAAPKIYGDDLRQAVHQLINEEQRPATQIASILRDRGFDQIPPVDTMRDWARASRHTITDRPKAEQLRTLLAGLVKATDAEISRINGETEPTDPARLKLLAETIKTIEPLLSEKPAGKGDEKVSGLLGGMEKAATHSAAATTSQGTTLRSLPA